MASYISNFVKFGVLVWELSRILYTGVDKQGFEVAVDDFAISEDLRHISG